MGVLLSPCCVLSKVCQCMHAHRNCLLFFIVEQDLDGNAIAMGLASTPGPDWLKDIIPTLGVRLKVHNALRTLYNANMVSLSHLTIRLTEESIYSHSHFLHQMISLAQALYLHLEKEVPLPLWYVCYL